MDRIQLDLVGPMGVPSKHGGHIYFQTGMDIGTRLSSVSLLKSKSDALRVSQASIEALEVESNTKLKSLRTDGGGEYTSAAWKSFADQKGFTHQLTAPYSPQQNGNIERLNRILIEKMRCLLLWSHLPPSFWDVALLHSNWLRNRTPTSALRGGIPLDAWSNTKTNFKKVHTFGCLVQYLKVGHDKDKKGNKFATKTAYGIFLGMPKNKAGYLIWDPTRPQIMVRDDVRFYDDVPGYQRLQIDKRSPAVPRDPEYFSLFPMHEETTVARIPATQNPHAPPAAPPPIDVIQLSSDTESGVNDDDNGEAEREVEGEGESIADRVAARHRAHYASFGDLL